MTNFCDLNIPLVPFKETYPIDSLKQHRHMKIHNEEILSTLFVKLLESLDITVSLVESFYSKKSVIQSIHIDSIGGDYTKLNFVYGGKGSLMHWYALKNNVSATSHVTEIGTNYSIYERNDVEIIESHPVKFPTLIQAGIPHNVTNPPMEDRLCISLFLRDLNTHQCLTMMDAKNRFKKYWYPEGDSNSQLFA